MDFSGSVGTLDDTNPTQLSKRHQMSPYTSCPCDKAEVQTRKHIVMEYNRHDPSTRLCNIIINSFVHFLADNPEAFSFDNR